MTKIQVQLPPKKRLEWLSDHQHKASTLSFNINHSVKVKLTEFGIECHEKEHNEFWERLGRTPPYKYEAPKVDALGYSSFQLWSLMNKFGPYMQMGLPTCFEGNNVFISTADVQTDEGAA